MKEHKYLINGVEYSVEINSVEGTAAEVTVNGVQYRVEMADSKPQTKEATVVDEKHRATSVSRSVFSVKSPLPGVIIEVNVKTGDIIRSGQRVAVVEAMKMENDIMAEQDGTVEKVLVSKGDAVQEGTDIVLIK